MRRVDGTDSFLRPTAGSWVTYSEDVDFGTKRVDLPHSYVRRLRCHTRILAGVLMGALAVCQAPSARAQRAQGEAPGPAQGARAKPDLAVAKQHFDDGEAKFRARDYGGAEIDFRIANNIKATPQAERYIGRCLDELGRLQSAAEWYDKFLAHAPDKMAVLADKTRRRLLAIRATPGKVHVESNPVGAAVTIDGKREAEPAPLDVELSPGPHTIGLAAPGRTKLERVIDVAFASAQTVSADLEAEAAPPEAASEPVAAEATDEAPPPQAQPAEAEAGPVEAPSRIPAYVTGGVAVVAAGVGAIFGVMALNDKATFDSTPSRQNADTRNVHALIADLALGSALALGITSVILFVTSRGPSAPADKTAKPPVVKGGSPRKSDAANGATVLTLTAAPMVGPHSGGAALVVRF
jgi:PEGA domain